MRNFWTSKSTSTHLEGTGIIAHFNSACSARRTAKLVVKTTRENLTACVRSCKFRTTLHQNIFERLDPTSLSEKTELFAENLSGQFGSPEQENQSGSIVVHSDETGNQFVGGNLVVIVVFGE